MQRYDIEEIGRGYMTYRDMVEASDGEYVRYDDVAELEADPPPEGFPSWEDWLAKEHNITLHSNKSDGRFSWVVRQVAENCRTSCGGFPDYPAALAAAKKEAGDA